MSESIQELRLDTPGFSPKKIINSTLANGFQVKEQQNISDFNTSPEKILKKQNGTAGSHLNNNNVKTTKNRNTNTVSNGIGSISEEGKYYLSIQLNRLTFLQFQLHVVQLQQIANILNFNSI